MYCVVLFFVGESTSKFCVFFFFCTPKKFEQNRLSRTTLLVIHCVHEQYSLLDTCGIGQCRVTFHAVSGCGELCSCNFFLPQVKLTNIKLSMHLSTSALHAPQVIFLVCFPRIGIFLHGGMIRINLHSCTHIHNCNK